MEWEKNEVFQFTAAHESNECEKAKKNVNETTSPFTHQMIECWKKGREK